MMPKMKRHGADTLWKVGTYEEIEGKKEKWNEGDTGRRIETNIFAYKHVHTYKHASHTCDFTHRFFTALTLLHTIVFTLNTVTHKHFYTQTLLHKRFYTETLLHTNTFNTDAFTDNHYYTQALVHADPLPEPTKLAKNPQFLTPKHHFVRKGCRRTDQSRKKSSVFDTPTSLDAKRLPPRMLNFNRNR